MVMKSLAFALVLALGLAAGCEPKDRESIAKDGGKALEHAGKAAMTAWKSISAKVSEITPESSKEAIEKARQSVMDLQKQAEAIPNPTPEVLAQIESARAAIAKIDAAEQLRALQDQATAIKNDLAEKAKAVGESAESAKSQIEAGNKQLKELQQQIDTARANYEEAAQAVEKLQPK